jgi:hypothetical protein
LKPAPEGTPHAYQFVSYLPSLSLSLLLCHLTTAVLTAALEGSSLGAYWLVSHSAVTVSVSAAAPLYNRCAHCSSGGEFSRWPDFKPAPEGTPYAYQFVPNQTFAIYGQAKQTTPWLLTYEEADLIAYNKDPAKGHVFEPSRDDYLATVDLGRKDSVNRTQVSECYNRRYFAPLMWHVARLSSCVFCVAPSLKGLG